MNQRLEIQTPDHKGVIKRKLKICLNISTNNKG